MPSTLREALAGVAAKKADATAIWYGDRSISFSELEEDVRRCAAGLLRQGITKGDRVALWLPNVPAWIVCFFALARIGAVALATNTRFRGSELRSIFSRAGIKAIVYWPGYRGIDFEKLLSDVAPHLLQLERVIEYGEGEERPVAPLPGKSFASVVGYRDLLMGATGGDDALDAAGLPCLLYTTSGTTSNPKLVVHAQGRIVKFACEVAVALGYDRPGACSLQAVPLCGTYGFIQAIAALMGGAPVVLMHTFDARAAAALIRDRGVTMSGMTDEMVRAVYAGESATKPFPGLRLFVGTRAHELLTLSQERGFQLTSGYGSSEVQALFSRRLDREEPVLRATGGGTPVSSRAMVRARDTITGEILPAGDPGEIEILSPSVMLGYLGDAEATARAFTNDGYYRTGDLGFVSDDGAWTFLSRIGDSLRLSGFLVDPLEIESHVRKAPGVDQCHVVGVEFAGSTVVVAFYTSVEVIDEEVLRQHCLDGMARYKTPHRFVHITEFSMIDSMNTRKLDRNALRARAKAMFAPGGGSG